jgi:uncharacterized protein (DUF1499 family)
MRVVDAAPDAAFAAAKQALAALDPAELSLRPEARRAHAVYRVALVFKDDVDLAVRARDAGQASLSEVHVRSASRVGYADFGVNRRRVNRFFDRFDAALAEHR